jgi:hypothetical protein
MQRKVVFIVQDVMVIELVICNIVLIVVFVFKDLTIIVDFLVNVLVDFKNIYFMHFYVVCLLDLLLC